jgi:D-arabinose 1-dehydrogenase-like Zn-dependent alcohol dehydrogenase
MVMHKMSLKHILVASLICLSAVAPAGLAQSGAPDPGAKNYKLSMEKIKAYDSATAKLQAVLASDPALQSSMMEALKKGGMMAALEGNPKLMAVIKASGISAQEFLIIPSCVQITASVYNSQAQGSAMGAMVSQENIAFYVKNKVEIDQIVKNWQTKPARK